MAHEVFICYAKEDERIADAVCEALEEKNIGCWYAKRDVPFGTPFEIAIIDAISKSRLMLLVLSSYSNASPHVTREIQNAFNEELQITVIPFRVEAIELSPALKYYLSSVQWLDASTPPLESHLERLAEYVASHLPRQDVKARERQKVKAGEAAHVRAGKRLGLEGAAVNGAEEAAGDTLDPEKAARWLTAREEAFRVEVERDAEGKRYREPMSMPERQRYESDMGAVREPAEEPEQRQAKTQGGFLNSINKRFKLIALAALILLIAGGAAIWLWPRAGKAMTATEHVDAGDNWAKQNKWDRAETEYRKAVQMDSSQAEWHHHLGDALFNQGKYEGAEAEYKEAVKLNESNANYQVSLAFALMQQQNWKDAAARFEKVVSINKTDYRWWSKLGVCYYNLQNWKAAENAFRQATGLVKGTGKNFAYLHVNLGDAFYVQRNWAGAISEYKEAVRIGSAGNSDSDKAMYQERLDNATKGQNENPDTVDPPELAPRNKN